MDWLNLIDPETLQTFLGEAISSQVAQFGIAFSLAALIHAGRVKKEIASQAAGIRIAFNNLADALKGDLKVQSERLGKVEDGVSELKDQVHKIDARVSAIEKP
jgi:hypothetical protein